MTITQGSIAGAGKQVFSKETTNYILNEEMPLWDKMIAKGRKEMAPNGLGYFFSPSFSVNQSGRFFGSSTGPFAGTSSMNPTQGNIVPKRMYFDISVDKAIEDIYPDAASSFIPHPVQRAIEETMIAAKKEYHRVLVSATGSGIITTVTTGATSATQTVGDSVYFNETMQIDIYDSTGVTLKGTRVIQSRDFTNNTVTFVTSVATATGDLMVRKGITPNGGEEPTGMPVIIGNSADATVFEGISRLTNGRWNSSVFNANGSSLTIDFVQKLIDRVEIENGKSEGIDFITCRHGQKRKIQELVLPQIRYADGAGIDAGAKDPAILGFTILADPYVKLGEIYGISSKNFGRYESAELGMASSPEGYTWLRKEGFDEMSSYMRGIINFGSERPSSHFKITNLLEPSY